ncbi:efflux RND transporter periplasmic adaptor subunit [Paenibacillus guangzhouensis]|uniref:efflux RND transporter periplasmic adaptor subunit n=1 Tax=Paenibacillus guangzhouensis TaxID=1473112 RepID=UPI0012669047|nr:efflux RND transporter periplasmic adaptor subunit [Paenibacillus guangzhouensis]
MQLQSAEQAVMGRKRTIRIVAVLFIFVLIAFTLLGNTIMALTLPKVTVIEPKPGQLTHTFKGSGILKWRAEMELVNPTSSIVKKIKVKKGDVVKKGQQLVIYERSDAEQQILDEQASLDKLRIAIEEQQSSYIMAVQNGDELLIKAAKRQIDTSKIDLDVQQRKIQKMQEDLTKSRVLVAPFDGMITEVAAIEGLASTRGGSDVRISNKSLGFESEVSVPARIASLLKIGDRLDVQVNGSQEEQDEGMLADIQDGNGSDLSSAGGGTPSNEPMKRLLITIQGGDWKGGEHVQVELTRQAAAEALLISNQAIHEDSSGKYVYRVEDRNGPLGNAFYVQRVPITVVDVNDHESAVTEGLFEQDQVVLESSEPLQEGNKVRMY